MGGVPYEIDLRTEKAALTSRRAEWIDSGAWAVILLGMWAIAWLTGG